MRVPGWDTEWLVRTCAVATHHHPAVEGKIITYGADEIDTLILWIKELGGGRVPQDQRNALLEAKRQFGGQVVEESVITAGRGLGAALTVK